MSCSGCVKLHLVQLGYISIACVLCMFIYILLLFQVISLLPGRILKLLEFVGFSGDRVLGIDLLTSGYQSRTCHSPLCSMALLAYYCVVAPYTGNGTCVFTMQCVSVL